MDIVHELEIAAPPAVLWDLTLDVVNWPSFTPTISSIELLDGPLHVGARARILQPHQRPRIWTVTTLDPPHHFEWAAALGPLRMFGGHHIDPTTTGCVNRLSIRFEGPGSTLARLVLGRPLRATIATENAGFRRTAEALSKDETIPRGL